MTLQKLFYAAASIRLQNEKDTEVLVAVPKQDIALVIDKIKNSEDLKEAVVESVLSVDWVDDIESLPLI